MTAPTTGTTLFSLTNEWNQARTNLPEFLHRVAAAGLGPDLEMVGFQSFRGFPHTDTAGFRALANQLELRPTALGVYLDPNRRTGHWASTAEQVAYLTPQLETAAAMGFSLVRLPLGIPYEVLDALYPVLQTSNVVLLQEIQGPIQPDAPQIAAAIDSFRTLGAEHLGFTLDFSVWTSTLPPAFTRALTTAGAVPRTVDAIAAHWRKLGPGRAQLSHVLQAEQDNLSDLTAAIVDWAFTRIGRSDPGDWTSVMTWVKHAHAKFWALDDEANPSNLTSHLHRGLQLLQDSCYTGSIITELGSVLWFQPEDVDAFDLCCQYTRVLRELISRIWSDQDASKLSERVHR